MLEAEAQRPVSSEGRSRTGLGPSQLAGAGRAGLLGGDASQRGPLRRPESDDSLTAGRESR